MLAIAFAHAPLDHVTAEGVRDLYIEYGKATKVYRGHEFDVAKKLAVVLRDFFKEQARTVVAKANGRPLLFSYSSDGTAYLCSEQATCMLAESKHHRDGRVLCEFLMERGCLRTRLAIGEVLSCILVAAPRLLLHGKDAWTQFSAACEFTPTVRSMGHRGIVVHSLSFDRAMHDSLSQKLKARLVAVYDDSMGLDLGEETHLLSLLDWTVAMADPFHDFQNAMRWGVASLSSPSLLSDFYIVLSSLRNSFSVLLKNLPEFVWTNLAFRPVAANAESVAAFWRAMGVPPDMLDAVCAVDPQWRSGRLMVAPEVREKAIYVDTLCDTLLFLL